MELISYSHIQDNDVIKDFYFDYFVNFINKNNSNEKIDSSNKCTFIYPNNVLVCCYKIAKSNLDFNNKNDIINVFDDIELNSGMFRILGNTSNINLIINKKSFNDLKTHYDKFSKANNTDFNGNIYLNIKIEDFQFIKVIGKGHFGKVSLVRFLKDKYFYALKSLKKSKLSKEKDLEHTILERKILALLNHPFIIKLKFAFQNTKKLYFVMEYHNGGELFYHMKKKDIFSEADAKFYISQIILAIEFLHSKKIIYRDLKPENIILDEFGYIKLTDFGLAKDNITSDNIAQTICGTTDYLAPEIIMGEKYGKSVDIWCIGILLYEMLFGIVILFFRLL